MDSSLVQIFSKRTEDIKSIFSSYQTLYEIYVAALRTSKANPNNIALLEHAKGSVDKAQRRISNQLYSQGFILLTGAAEALLKDVFVSLLKENFTEVDVPSVNFSAKEVQEILRSTEAEADTLKNISTELGNLTVEKLYSSKNPIEKVNFQNVQTTKDALKSYFGVELTNSEYSKNIHKYWQMRHTLVHNSGLIDQRYISNVQKVGLLEKNEKIGKKITISKAKFNEADEDFLNLFSEIDQLVEATSLKFGLTHSNRQS